jgi:hypothetical protein
VTRQVIRYESEAINQGNIQYTYIVGKYKIYLYELGADKYETGTNVTRTTKKTPLTTFMKAEEWRLLLSFLFKLWKYLVFRYCCVCKKSLAGFYLLTLKNKCQFCMFEFPTSQQLVKWWQPTVYNWHLFFNVNK